MKAVRFLVLSGLFVLATQIASAQPAGGGPGGPPAGGTPPCWPPPCVPIDGGLGFLIVAGAALGGKKLYDYRKHSNNENIG